MEGRINFFSERWIPGLSPNANRLYIVNHTLLHVQGKACFPASKDDGSLGDF